MRTTGQQTTENPTHRNVIVLVGNPLTDLPVFEETERVEPDVLPRRYIAEPNPKLGPILHRTKQLKRKFRTGVFAVLVAQMEAAR